MNRQTAPTEWNAATDNLTKPLLTINNLKTEFRVKSDRVKAVDDVSLKIYRNSILALVGETGCGKSVLGLSIIRLLPDNAVCTGSICYDGIDLLQAEEKTVRRLRGKEIGMIPQNPASALNPLMRIGAQVKEVLKLHKPIADQAAQKETEGLFSRLQLPEPTARMKGYPHQLSGGMRQRVLIAMGIACGPKLILVDEPTKGLDAALRKEVVNLLKEQAYANDSAMLLITHDFSVAAALADEIAVMYAGEIVETGGSEKILSQPLHPYTLSLLESLPSRGFKPIPGFSPSLADLPSGCRFQPRCRKAEPDCIACHPQLQRVEKNREVRCSHVGRG
jgi:peptide/nickel transport system ATP-binding protein